MAFEVFHVMNLTDVDDRTIQDAFAAGKTLDDHVQQFIDAFFADRDFLRIEPADVYPRATSVHRTHDHPHRGSAGEGCCVTAARTARSISPSNRFPAYGRLSQLDRRELKAGASQRCVIRRVRQGGRARDFVLWKAVKDEDEQVGAAWDAPFGRGRPGWHLECSTMGAPGDYGGGTVSQCWTSMSAGSI